MKHEEAVANLHKSGILPEVIAMQLDLRKEEVMRIINDTNVQNERKSAKQAAAASASVFYLDAIVHIDSIIRSAQLEMWGCVSSKTGELYNLYGPSS